MIEYVWGQLIELWSFFAANFDWRRDLIDIAVVALGVYWLLLLIRRTRAVQILAGLLLLFAVFAASQLFELATLSFILDRFLPSAVLIIIILFQNDIRRALASVGRGFFPNAAERGVSQILEEVVRAAQTLAQKRVGALVVLERENHVDDQIEAGVTLDAVVSKELLTSIFLPYSPLHDGAVVIQNGRIAHAGCILPLTLRQDLPEGVGTRHRAAVGITEETDAVVVVVSEQTASISVVMGGEMSRDLDPPRLREVLRDALTGGRGEPGAAGEPPPAADAPQRRGADEAVPSAAGSTQSSVSAAGRPEAAARAAGGR
ncbi:MAG TPA: diadenylate cyclase CdaA [Myxococcota bacterium]|nr:diadenylate cyclase CdaA [Myxococcota bacterium]